MIASSGIVRRFVLVPLFVSDYALKYKARLYSKQKGMSTRKGIPCLKILTGGYFIGSRYSRCAIQELG